MLDANTLECLLSGHLPDNKALEFLASLTPDQIDDASFNQVCDALGKTAVTIPTLNTPVMDCCGTGGSGLSGFNTSTAVAFILASAGVPVVKFGNRAVTSASGSFDFLEALSIPLTFPLESLPDLLHDSGLVFLFAGQVFPGMAKLRDLRQKVGVKTVFNYVGPVLNPVNPPYRLLGASHPKMQSFIAERLSRAAHNQKSWVVRADNHLDELALDVPTTILEVTPAGITELDRTPATGYAATSSSGSSAQDNVERFEQMINGTDHQSDVYELVCLNAGAGLVVSGKATSLDHGIEQAKDLLSSGAVLAQLDKTRRAYARYA